MKSMTCYTPIRPTSRPSLSTSTVFWRCSRCLAVHLVASNTRWSCCQCLKVHTDVFFICLWWQSFDFSVCSVDCAVSLTLSLNSTSAAPHSSLWTVCQISRTTPALTSTHLLPLRCAWAEAWATGLYTFISLVLVIVRYFPRPRLVGATVRIEAHEQAHTGDLSPPAWVPSPSFCLS